MNTKELKNIIKQIQEGEGVNLTAIAAQSGVGRSYLSTLINDNETKTVEAPLIGKLSKAYPAYFKGQNRTEQIDLEQVMASLKEIREYAISLITGQTAGHEVIMGALDRLEKNPEGSLSEAADRLALKLAERLNVIQTGKKANVSKRG